MLILENATKFHYYDVSRFRRIRKLLENPIVYLYGSDLGDTFLFYLVDADEKVKRWMIIQVMAWDYDDFLFGKKSLQDLVKKPAKDCLIFVESVDYPGDKVLFDNQMFCFANEVPEKYMPKEDSFYGSWLDGQKD